ncbi:MAG TPA: hypothetical protein VJU77_06695 [Chthoniobacterales bacterium]|nr:hypothetical protein [Chthoniobacterales bacterium]
MIEVGVVIADRLFPAAKKRELKPGQLMNVARTCGIVSRMARLRYRREDATESASEKFHHNVYVILLDPKVAKHPTVLRMNPKRDPAKPCVYVGMSGLPPEHRFENHKHGYKAAWVVEKYGVQLLPELYEHLNPMPYEAALQMELELAEDLRNEGYTVTGGH